MVTTAIVAGVATVVAWFMGANIASLTLFAIVGGLASFLSWVIGVVSTVLTYILFQILPYNNFINEDVVKIGWVTVRDICNMFFILILLIIAFATILRIESYSWKKNLPKLLVMAVLINFSKTICGLIIDFSQVIMLTFVNAFSSAGAYNLYTIFGLKNLFTVNTAVKSLSTTTNIDTNTGFSVAGSLVLGLILIMIATIVIFIYTVILIYRIIMLWILIILSPLAFLAMAIPAGTKYASQWTSEFSKYVVIGPVMAFFLWLALSIATATTIPIDYQYTTIDNRAVNIPNAPQGTGSVAGEPANMKQFLVATLFLIASLMMAQQVGGAVGSLAGGAVSKIKHAGGLVGKGTLKGVKNLAGVGLDTLSGAARIDFNVVRGYKRMKKQMEDNKKERELKIYQGALEKSAEGGAGRRLAQISTGDLMWQQVKSFWKDDYGPTKRFFKPLKWTQAEEKKKEEELKALNDRRNTSYTDKQLEAADHSVKIYEGQLATIDADITRAETKKAGLTDYDKIEALNTQIENWQSKKDKIEKFVAIEQDKHNHKISDEDVEDIDNRKKEIVKELEPYKLRDYTILRNKAQSELEGEQQKKIFNIDNNQELGQILVGAIKEGNQGLVAAVSKKMTKNYDYNEMLKVLGLGTGREGMLDYVNKLQDAGFSRQAALGLVGEVGNIAKSLKHFGAFGAVTMENGKWRESSRDEYNANIYAEMSKLQIQDFARNTNRLGLGEYIGGDHSIENWRPLEATLKLYEENASRLVRQYADTGQPNALLHMAHYDDYMKAAGVGEALRDIIRNSAGGGDVNWVRAVKGVKEALERELDIKIESTKYDI